MSGEGSFLGKRNSVNKGTKVRKYMASWGMLVCLEGRVACREEERQRKTSVKGLPYMPCLGTRLYSVGR